jgi:hypothetical protein
MSVVKLWFDDSFRTVHRAVLSIVAILFLLVYIGIALVRISYPFELEWMEGGSVIQVQRVLEGNPLYVKPSLGFIPFIYGPVYFYASACVAAVTGNGFLPLRLVSFLSSIGCFACIALIVYRRSRSPFVSLLAGCLFAATFRIGGAFFDLARVDSLFLVLLLAGIYALESPRGWIRMCIAPALLSLSFFTKQSALIVIGTMLLGVMLTRPLREKVVITLVLLVLIGGGVLLLDGLSGGWFTYYTVTVPSGHELQPNVLLEFWTKDLFPVMGIAAVFSVAGFAARDRIAWRGEALRDVLVFTALMAAGYVSRIHFGGFENVLMVAFAGLAIFFGLGLAELIKQQNASPLWSRVVLAGVVVQFIALGFDPRDQVPSQADRAAGTSIVRRIASFRGDVFVFCHPELLRQAGKPTTMHGYAFDDIVRAEYGSGSQYQVEQQLAAMVGAGGYDAIIADSYGEVKRFMPDIGKHYTLVDKSLSRDVFHPVTGSDTRPSLLFVRTDLVLTHP